LRRFAAGLLLLLAGPLPARAPSEAMALLAKAAEAFHGGGARTAAFTQIYTPAGFATSKRESGEIWVQAPDLLRFDYAAPDPKVFTYDAGEGRFFLPEDKQLTIRRLSADEQARLPIVFLQKPEDLARRWLKLSIDATGRVGTLAYADTGGNQTEFRFEGWRTEKPRPESDYRVTGPKGTRVIED
jgi:hypothetical protein